MSGYSWHLANSGPSLPKPQSLLIRQSNILFICKSHHYPCLAKKKKKVSPESGIIVIIMIKGRLYIDNEYHPREQQCLNISWDRLSRLWRRQRRIPLSNQEISNIDELIYVRIVIHPAWLGPLAQRYTWPPPVLLLSILEIE